MKKLLVLVLAMMLLVGCSQQKKDTTFMVTRDNTLYALYNQNGERLTEYSYKTFEEVSGIGYIVTDANDQKGVISDKGDEIIKPQEKIDSTVLGHEIDSYRPSVLGNTIQTNKKVKTSDSQELGGYIILTMGSAICFCFLKKKEFY